MSERSEFQTVGDPTSSDTKALGILAGFDAVKVTESSSFWLNIVGNPAYSEVRRRECIFQLFKRHVPAGTLASSLHSFENAILFSDTNLFDASIWTSVPIKVRLQGSIYMFQDELMELDHSAIYMRFSTGIDRTDLLRILHGADNTNDVKIVEIGFSRPRSSNSQPLKNITATNSNLI